MISNAVAHAGIHAHAGGDGGGSAGDGAAAAGGGRGGGGGGGSGSRPPQKGLLCSTTADSGAPNRLELLAEDVLISALKLSQKVAIIVSEISTEPVFVPGAAVNKSKYGVVLDPLDGSTNIECESSVFSICVCKAVYMCVCV